MGRILKAKVDSFAFFNKKSLRKLEPSLIVLTLRIYLLLLLLLKLHCLLDPNNFISSKQIIFLNTSNIFRHKQFSHIQVLPMNLII
jgi:hypothetical protein